MGTALPQLLTQELKMLQKEKGKTCLSIIIPFDNFSDKKTGIKHIEKAIEAVSDELRLTHSIEANVLIKSLSELCSEIDVERNEIGLGLFVSNSIRHLTWFPFSVKEKITVSNRFDLRDVSYKLQYFIPYYVLFFDTYEARLYSGTQKQLLELRNKAFPLSYYDNDSYGIISKNSSFSQNIHAERFERGRVEKELFESFFSEADELLSVYIESSDALIL